MRTLVSLIVLLFIGANITSCTPEQLADEIIPQACCDGGEHSPPPPPPGF